MFKSGETLEPIVSGSLISYRYTSADGTVINFSANQNRATDMTYPDGTKLTYIYDTGHLKAVFSNRGWAILFESPAKSCAVNTARTYVTATSSCPSDALTATYTYGAGTYSPYTNRLLSVTKAGATRTYGYASNDHVNCVTDPGQSSCRISNAYTACPNNPQRTNPIQPDVRRQDPVTSQTDGSGRTYTYTYAFDSCPVFLEEDIHDDMRRWSANTVTIAETGVAGTTQAITQPDNNLAQLTDPLGRATTFAYLTDTQLSYVDWNETSNLTTVIYPEGNSLDTQVTDARGNITASKIIAKDGVTTLTTTATYPTSCSATTRLVCNKPNSITDAMSVTTDFTYDAAHGGVLTETGPAATAGGIRPVKRYAYVQRQPWLKNSAGGFSASDPIWLLSETRICRTTATTGNACAGGSADEVVTTYEYEQGSATKGSNLLQTGVAVTADGQTLRTCYGYDRDGRKISETTPNANLSVCP